MTHPPDELAHAAAPSPSKCLFKLLKLVLRSRVRSNETTQLHRLGEACDFFGWCAPAAGKSLTHGQADPSFQPEGKGGGTEGSVFVAGFDPARVPWKLTALGPRFRLLEG